MSGNFSSEFACYENEETSIPFYNEDYEAELLSTVGLAQGGPGESVVPSAGTPSNMSGMNPLDDLDYFLDFAEVQEYLPPVDLSFDLNDFNCLSPYPADVKPEVKEEPIQSHAPQRYEPYPEPSREDAKQRKRGRPMKTSSTSKMANYSRQYRETKKKELMVSQDRADKLKKENDELRSQLMEMTTYVQRIEAELSKLRRSHQQYVHSVPVMAVQQPY